MLERFFDQQKKNVQSCANKQKIRKTDVALTSHSLELECQFSYSSAAVCNGQVGS